MDTNKEKDKDIEVRDEQDIPEQNEDVESVEALKQRIQELENEISELRQGKEAESQETEEVRNARAEAVNALCMAAAIKAGYNETITEIIPVTSYEEFTERLNLLDEFIKAITSPKLFLRDGKESVFLDSKYLSELHASFTETCYQIALDLYSEYQKTGVDLYEGDPDLPENPLLSSDGSHTSKTIHSYFTGLQRANSRFQRVDKRKGKVK